MNSENEKFEQWAIVDVMGHNRFVGLVTEQVVAGAGFVRVDVPKTSKLPAWSKLIGTGSIYSITPVERDIAVAMVERMQKQPIQAFELTTELITSANQHAIEFGDGEHVDDGWGV